VSDEARVAQLEAAIPGWRDRVEELTEQVSRLEVERDRFLAAFEEWREVTDRRCRLISNREASDVRLFPDSEFIARVEALRQ
jgi:hypothetical protein